MMHRPQPSSTARVLRLALAALALAAAGCSSSTDPGPAHAGIRLSPTQARVKWHSRGVTDYQLVVERGWCECLPEWTRPMRVAVRESGAQVTVTDLERGTPVSLAANDRPLTVENLFLLIDELREEGVYRLDVLYDPIYGFPTLIDVDRDRQMVDDEFRIMVREFEVLE
jgi:hypothetical protein